MYFRLLILCLTLLGTQSNSMDTASVAVPNLRLEFNKSTGKYHIPDGTLYDMASKGDAKGLDALAKAAKRYKLTRSREDATNAFDFAATIAFNKKTTAILMAFDPDLNRQDEKGRTALHYAVQESLGMVDTIVSHGGDAVSLSIQDNEGNTPLHLCAYFKQSKGNPTIPLIAYGANITIKNNSGETPLDIAAQAGALKSVEAFLSTGEIPQKQLQESADKLSDETHAATKMMLSKPCSHLIRLPENKKRKLNGVLIHRAHNTVGFPAGYSGGSILHRLMNREIGSNKRRKIIH